MKDHSSDYNLIIGLKKNNHDSFKELFDRYSNPLFQFSLRYLKSNDAAEDVVQEVFTKIWSNRKKINSDTSFKSYLFIIALNSIRKQFNKQTRFNEVRHDVLLDLHQNESEFDSREDYQSLLNKLDELINKMPEKRKQVFIKKKLEKKSLKEIAQEMDISTEKDKWDSQAVFAPNILYTNGKYYLFYTGVKPTPANGEFENNNITDITAIGVAASDSPTGPYKRVSEDGQIIDNNVKNIFADRWEFIGTFV